MIIGCGTDIIEISRIKEAVEKWGDNFLKRVFTEKELDYSLPKRFSYQHLAARFAAKEALLKAFGSGFHTASWVEAEITNDSFGRPKVKLYGRLKELMQEKKVDDIIISMSHAKTCAQAIAILLRGER